MKIGIITACDNCGNYGAFLQMYALGKYLKDTGNDVYYVLPPIQRRYILRSLSAYNEAYILKKDKLLFIRKLWKKVRMVQYLIVNSFIYARYRIQAKGCHFCSIRTAKEKCDLIIAGSDEIWNCCNPSLDHPFYYGADFPEKQKISYAVCTGDAEKHDYEKRSGIEDLLKTYKKISARDSRSVNLLSCVTGQPCFQVCDPTFLIQWEGLPSKIFTLPQKYILVYAWELSHHNISNLKKFAKEKNLSIVCTMGLRKFDFADVNLDIPPLSFPEIVRNAEYVYAGTFHGSVFAIIYAKRAVFDTQSEKVRFLLEQYSLEDRLLNEDVTFEFFSEILDKQINIGKIEQITARERDKSQKWLKESLSN